MKQTINNACGTIGLIHAIANNRDKMNFGKIFLVWFLLASPFFPQLWEAMEGRVCFVLFSLNITIRKDWRSAFLPIITKLLFYTNLRTKALERLQRAVSLLCLKNTVQFYLIFRSFVGFCKLWMKLELKHDTNYVFLNFFKKLILHWKSS